MALRKVWFIEEIPGAGDVVAQRISQYFFDDVTGEYVRPDDRLGSPTAIAKWNQVMSRLENVNGEDLRYLVNPAGLVDFCVAKAQSKQVRRRGT